LLTLARLSAANLGLFVGLAGGLIGGVQPIDNEGGVNLLAVMDSAGWACLAGVGWCHARALIGAINIRALAEHTLFFGRKNRRYCRRAKPTKPRYSRRIDLTDSYYILFSVRGGGT